MSTQKNDPYDGVAWSYRVKYDGSTGTEFISVFEVKEDVLDEDEESDYSVCGIWGGVTEESKRNARLISSSPEMLSKMKAMYNALVMMGCELDIVDEVEEFLNNLKKQL